MRKSFVLASKEPSLRGELTADTNAAAMAGLIQAIRHRVSTQSNRGTRRETLLEAARLALRLIRQLPTGKQNR